MTNVTAPNTGSLPQQGSRKFGSVVGAIVLVVATGAAIATGVVITTDDAPVVQGQVDAADRAHLNRSLEAAAAAAATEAIDPADRAHLNRSREFAAAAAQGTIDSSDRAFNRAAAAAAAQAIDPADRAHLNRSREFAAAAAATGNGWAYPTSVEGLVESGLIPAETLGSALQPSEKWPYPTSFDDLVRNGTIPSPPVE